jgi:hypothetical protein
MYNAAMTEHVTKWTHYRDTRKGTYEFRARTRYKAVADRLFALGMNNRHTLVDVGAGTCQFGQYLRERGWRGEYIPIDAVIDGTDLETWTARPADYMVSIEVVEHVHSPYRLLDTMVRNARRAIVITTPNHEAVDVIGCDPTHVSVVPAWALEGDGFTVERASWFGVPDDTLLAWRGQ